MKEMRSLTIGLVGCGYIGQKHLRYWRNVDRAPVTAVCDTDRARAETAAKRWHIPAFYGDFSEMLKNESVSIVDICTPPEAHCALTIQALDANRHALVEKPLVLTTEEAKRLIAAQEGSSTKIFPIHNNIFDPVMAKALTLIKGGDLGEITNVSVHMLIWSNDVRSRSEDHWSHSSPAGRINDILPHPIYIIQAILGHKLHIRSVCAQKFGNNPLLMCDELRIELKGGKSFASIYASLNSVRNAFYVDVYGTAGILKMDMVDQTLVRLKQRPPSINTLHRGADSLTQALQLFRSTAENGFSKLLGRWETGHEVIMRTSIDSILSDTAPAVTLEEACASVEVFEQVCHQIDTAAA